VGEHFEPGGGCRRGRLPAAAAAVAATHHMHRPVNAVGLPAHPSFPCRAVAAAGRSSEQGGLQAPRPAGHLCRQAPRLAPDCPAFLRRQCRCSCCGGGGGGRSRNYAEQLALLYIAELRQQGNETHIPFPAAVAGAANSVEWMLCIRAADVLSGTIGEQMPTAAEASAALRKCHAWAAGALLLASFLALSRLAVIGVLPVPLCSPHALTLYMPTHMNACPTLPCPCSCCPAVPIYDSLGESAVEYIVQHSGGCWHGGRAGVAHEQHGRPAAWLSLPASDAAAPLQPHPDVPCLPLTPRP
jgi:hypothetical protein